MANQNQPVRACRLKVDKCCTGCFEKAKKKLESISGVSAVDYNKEKALMTVTGNVEPLTLVNKLIRRGKKAELVSVKYKLDDDKDHQMVDEEEDEEEDTASDTSSNPDIKTQEVKEKESDKSNKTKWCLWKKSKPKEVQSLKKLNSHWHVPSKFENGFGPGFSFGSVNPYAPMMWGHPYPPMMQPQGYHPLMQQQCFPQMMQQQQQKPQVPTTGAAKPQNANNTMPQQPIPYYQTVNPKLHYK